MRDLNEETEAEARLRWNLETSKERHERISETTRALGCILPPPADWGTIWSY